MHRTYVRRRVVAASLLLGLVGLAVGPIGGALATETMRPAAQIRYVVAPGDTLWAIAGEVAGDRDPRAVVHDIAQVNGVDAGSIVPGQVLLLPAHG